MHTVKLLVSVAALAVLTSGAMAADLAKPMKMAPVMAAPVASNWDGAYIGANIAYGPGSATSTSAHYYDDTSDTITTDDSLDFSGLSVGGQIGYNFHLSDKLVGGIEGSLNWANESGTAGDDQDYPGITQTINWDGNLVARLGLDMGQFLPYIDGGLAFANSTRDSSGCATSGPGRCYFEDSSHKSDTQTQMGWTVGVGVEGKITDNMSAFVAYNYADYGNADYNTGGYYIPSVHLTDNIVKGGINFHF